MCVVEIFLAAGRASEPDLLAGCHLEYVDLEAGDAVVGRMIEQAQVDIPEATEHRTSADPARSIGRWRTDLSPALRGVCARSFGEVLREFGYENNGAAIEP